MKVCWIDFPESKGRLGVLPKESIENQYLERLGELKAEGVSLIVSLLGDAEVEGEAEGPKVEAEGMKFQWFPLADWGVPKDDAHAAQILAPITAALQAGESVVVHCHYGIGRSPTIAALAMVHHGVSALESISRISRARQHRVPDTAAQANWVIEYERRLTSRAQTSEPSH